MAYELPKLDYPYDALEPHIDARTMEIHHAKHHQAYVANLNKALENSPHLAAKDIDEVIADLAAVPEAARAMVRNNGGGHSNHRFFWKVIGPGKGGNPKGALAEAINKKWGGLEKLKEELNAAGIARFGSGWAWLCAKNDGSLCVCSTPNQDSPLMKGIADCPGKPVIGIDVWEHAYYLKYQNRRADYLQAFWNVVNWDQAEENYRKAKGG